jgi:chromosomal replication initiation ATPase DnaA
MSVNAAKPILFQAFEGFVPQQRVVYSLWRGRVVVRPKRLSMRDIAQQVCVDYRISFRELLNSSTFRASEIRHLAMWMQREQGFSYPQIGNFWGRHHTTIIYGVKVHCERMSAAN